MAGNSSMSHNIFFIKKKGTVDVFISTDTLA